MDNVFEKVKKTFQKITFTTENQIVTGDYLIIMNIPPIMGRRDAAYDRAIYLLRECLFSYPEEGRNDIYSSVIKLLNISIESTKLIVNAVKSTKNYEGESIMQYLTLLFDTVTAASSMVKHEITLFKDEHTISDFIGRDLAKQFRSTDEIFSNSEMNIYHCINELVDIAEPTIQKYREYMKKSFSNNNLNRYMKSNSEYQAFYKTFGAQEKETAKTV